MSVRWANERNRGRGRDCGAEVAGSDQNWTPRQSSHDLVDFTLEVSMQSATSSRPFSDCEELEYIHDGVETHETRLRVRRVGSFPPTKPQTLTSKSFTRGILRKTHLDPEMTTFLRRSDFVVPYDLRAIPSSDRFVVEKASSPLENALKNQKLAVPSARLPRTGGVPTAGPLCFTAISSSGQSPRYPLGEHCHPLAIGGLGAKQRERVPALRPGGN
ncbi:hypothetical protein C8R47DRAFT_1070082 [Mycena vitilis]|nr:hypothetical protein C8R47DRAFT_1070082 [Mycena vitilis]